MLIQPTLESLMKKVDSKYTLVTLAAKRARELTDGDAPFVDVNTNKVVSVAMEEIICKVYPLITGIIFSLAMEEINEGKIKYETPQAGIK